MTDALARLRAQGLTDLTPWHVYTVEQAAHRTLALRGRYARAYEAFAFRQDNDDVACFDPDHAGRVIIVHDYASPGWERHDEYASVWDWFRAAIEAMIELE